MPHTPSPSPRKKVKKNDLPQAASSVLAPDLKIDVEDDTAKQRVVTITHTTPSDKSTTTVKASSADALTIDCGDLRVKVASAVKDEEELRDDNSVTVVVWDERHQRTELKATRQMLIGDVFRNYAVKMSLDYDRLQFSDRASIMHRPLRPHKRLGTIVERYLNYAEFLVRNLDDPVDYNTFSEDSSEGDSDDHDS